MGGQLIVSKVEVAGMGGVGKTQLVTEVSSLKFVFNDVYITTHLITQSIVTAISLEIMV